MLADRKWVERNLGFDPITTPPPRETFTIKRVADAAAKKTANEHQRLAPDHRRSAADARHHDRHGRRHRQGIRGRRRRRLTDRAFRLPVEVQEAALRAGALFQQVRRDDFFGFDTSDDHFHLQGIGDVSDPQIKAEAP
jgi:hypothetical protein